MFWNAESTETIKYAQKERLRRAAAENLGECVRKTFLKSKHKTQLCADTRIAQT